MKTVSVIVAVSLMLLTAAVCFTSSILSAI